VTVNGHPEAKAGRAEGRCGRTRRALPNGNVPDGTKQKLDTLGPEKFGEWMRNEKRVLMTDTTMRDGHQSLLATRMRTHDIAGIAGTYARRCRNLLSLECWGGATFDVSMRFLTEDPWERLSLVREAAPNLLLQMLLRGANGVGYTNYPDNVVKYFVKPGGAGRHRSVPRVRLPELGREHARLDGCGRPRRTSSAKRRSAIPAIS
jgi:pyruvate carboxylase